MKNLYVQLSAHLTHSTGTNRWDKKDIAEQKFTLSEAGREERKHVRPANKAKTCDALSVTEKANSSDAVAMRLMPALSNGNVFGIHRTLKLVKSGKYDIIHSGAKGNMIASIINNNRRSVVTTVHSDPHLDYMHSILKSIPLV